MNVNRTKAKLRAGQPVIGTILNFAAPAIVELCGYAGFDFIILDCEHGPMTPESVEMLVRAAEVADITPIVRVTECAQQTILRFLDTGALGIQVPQTSTRAEVELAARAAKYAPEGIRGLAGSRWSRYGQGGPLGEQVVKANQEILVAVHVETAAAIANLPEMLQVPGVDVFFIGPTDLSQSLGVPGQINHPKVQSAIDTIVEQVRNAGRVVGILAPDGPSLQRAHERGILYTIVGCSSLFMAGAKAYLSSVRR